MGAYLVIFMYTMCAFMMAFAILQLGVAWFAVRRAQAWGVWAGLLANEAVVPYYLAVSASFAQRGAPILGGLEFILVITAAARSPPVPWLGGGRGAPRAPRPSLLGGGGPPSPAAGRATTRPRRGAAATGVSA